MSRHLKNLTIVYRWEVCAEESWKDFFSHSPISLVDFLMDSNRASHFQKFGYEDLRLSSITYGSPTIESLEGLSRGLTGIAGLIERLVHFKSTRRLKQLEVEERELEILSLKAEVSEKIRAHMLAANCSDKEIDMAMRRYNLALWDFDGSVYRDEIKAIQITKKFGDVGEPSDTEPIVSHGDQTVWREG